MHRPLSRSLRSLFASIFVAAVLFAPFGPALARGGGDAAGSGTTDSTVTATGGTASPAAAPAAAAGAATTEAQKTTQENESVGQSSSLTDSIVSVFASVASVIASFIGKLIILVLDVTIPVMQYQGFVGSPVVIAGWAIVRDVVNMFFVVVLIVIAMGTIFGSSKFTWRQQVPKLMLFAILINFSKTLCGLMIDFAQVIMLTFANALKDIAGGNFIQLLGLGPMMQLSESADSTIGSFDLFTASAAAVIMMVWVLAIVIMLLFILIYRVVMLWILIVMAPLAWFTAAVPFDQAKGSYAEWWKNFVCYCTVGPVITFFLWLTLAVAGSGNIAANDAGFSSASPDELSQNTAGGLTAIFEWQHLTSFVIGMAMLVAGMDAAAKVCNGVKGPGFNKLLSATKGGGFINQFAGAQARKYGEKGAKKGWAGTKSLAGGTGAAIVAAGATGSLAGFGMGRAGQAARAEGLRAASKTLGAHGFGGLARSASLASDERQADLAKTMKEEAETTYKGASDETKIDELIRLANGGGQAFEGGANMGLLAEALKNPKMREKLEASGVLTKLADKSKGPSQIDKLKQQLKGTKEYDAIEEFENGRPDLTGKHASINTFEELEKLDPAALAAIASDPKMKAEFEKNLADKGIMSNTYHNGKALSAKEWLDNKRGGGKRGKAWLEGKTGYYESLSAANLALVPKEDLASNLSDALVTKQPDVAGVAMRSRSSRPRTRMNLDKKAKHQVNAGAGIGYNATTGKINSVDAAKIRDAVIKNPLAVKNVSIEDDNASGDLKQAIAGAYMDQAVLKDLLNQYKISSAGDRREMAATIMENVFQSFDAEESKALKAGNTGLATNISTQRNNLKIQLESIEGGNTNMVAEIRNARTVLRTEETQLAALGARATAEQVARLEIVRADVARLGNYGMRF